MVARGPIITSLEPREDWSNCYVDDAWLELAGSA
jgi:hypothetical protein